MKLNQHSWLVSLLSQYPNGCTLVEINDHWRESNAYNGRSISRTSLFRARDTILNQYGILIDCEAHRGNSRYKIGNPSELQRDSMKNWLYSNLTVGNLLADHTAQKDHILLEYTPVNTSHLHSILQALKDRQLVVLTYQKYTDASSSVRTLAPLAIKLWKQRWYLLALQAGEDKTTFEEGEIPNFIRVFSLNRVKDIVPTQVRFKIPQSFSAQEYFAEYYGVFIDKTVAPQRIVIRAFGQTPHYLRDLPLHHSQREIETTPTHTDFELHLRPTHDFLMHLLTHGTGLRILSPQGVVEEMKRIVAEMGEFVV